MSALLYPVNIAEFFDRFGLDSEADLFPDLTDQGNDLILARLDSAAREFAVFYLLTVYDRDLPVAKNNAARRRRMNASPFGS